MSHACPSQGWPVFWTPGLLRDIGHCTNPACEFNRRGGPVLRRWRWSR